MIMNERVVAFLKKNTNLTLATCINNKPYCAHCFYAFDEEKNLLVFKSSKETNHIREARENRNVAGSVAPDKLDVTKIQGIQFKGNFIEPGNEIVEHLKKIYYTKYPFSRAFPGDMWAIELTYIKMTDNTLGFGKKIEWSVGAKSEKK
jgi:hypothetical protein